MAVDLRTTQEYLNDKLGTVGLTKQQCLQRLAGSMPFDATRTDAWNKYAATLGTGRSAQEAANIKVANTGLSIQEAARRL